MPHLIYPIQSDFFHQEIRPALAGCWQQRSFKPCLPLCRRLLARGDDAAAPYHRLTDTILLENIAMVPEFDRHIWRALVGEGLLLAAAELPLLEISPRSICALLAPENLGRDLPRPQFAPIEQVFLGSHDLVFAGGYYRPDHAGWNDYGDVIRLAEYLRKIQPENWQSESLKKLCELAFDEERIEELEYLRQVWPGLVDVYVNAVGNRQVLICEAE